MFTYGYEWLLMDYDDDDDDPHIVIIRRNYQTYHGDMKIYCIQIFLPKDHLQGRYFRHQKVDVAWRRPSCCEELQAESPIVKGNFRIGCFTMK
jgi:hypothetical protein